MKPEQARRMYVPESCKRYVLYAKLTIVMYTHSERMGECMCVRNILIHTGGGWIHNDIQLYKAIIRPVAGVRGPSVALLTAGLPLQGLGTGAEASPSHLFWGWLLPCTSPSMLQGCPHCLIAVWGHVKHSTPWWICLDTSFAICYLSRGYTDILWGNQGASHNSFPAHGGTETASYSGPSAYWID